MSKYNYPDFIYIPQSIHLKSLFPKGYITSSCQSLEQNVKIPSPAIRPYTVLYSRLIHDSAT